MAIVCGTPAAGDIFRGDKCVIGHGALVIDLRTCDIIMVSIMTLDNAAKLAASTIYGVMESDTPSSPEPEWVNSVTFASEEFMETPAIRVVDNRLLYNSPPFKRTKKNLRFWELFAKYWYVMVVRAMNKSLYSCKTKTAKEQSIIDKYSAVRV